MEESLIEEYEFVKVASSIPSLKQPARQGCQLSSAKQNVKDEGVNLAAVVPNSTRHIRFERFKY